MHVADSPDRKTDQRAPSETDRARPGPRALGYATTAFTRRAAALIARRWLLLVNLGCALLLAGAVGVAYLRSVGAGWLSEPLATAYLLLCPQRPDHSYFPFGYQMALEHREVAMLGAQLLGGLGFGLIGGRLRGLDWSLVVLLSMPMLGDVLSQMVGLRESNWLIRTWTGGLFTLAFVLWLYPIVDAVIWSERAARSGRATAAAISGRRLGG
jgi:uncharacterized membrane protein